MCFYALSVFTVGRENKCVKVSYAKINWYKKVVVQPILSILGSMAEHSDDPLRYGGQGNVVNADQQGNVASTKTREKKIIQDKSNEAETKDSNHGDGNNRHEKSIQESREENVTSSDLNKHLFEKNESVDIKQPITHEENNQTSEASYHQIDAEKRAEAGFYYTSRSYSSVVTANITQVQPSTKQVKT